MGAKFYPINTVSSNNDMVVNSSWSRIAKLRMIRLSFPWISLNQSKNSREQAREDLGLGADNGLSITCQD